MPAGILIHLITGSTHDTFTAFNREAETERLTNQKKCQMSKFLLKKISLSATISWNSLEVLWLQYKKYNTIQYKKACCIAKHLQTDFPASPVPHSICMMDKCLFYLHTLDALE